MTKKGGKVFVSKIQEAFKLALQSKCEKHFWIAGRCKYCGEQYVKQGINRSIRARERFIRMIEIQAEQERKAA